MTDRTDRALVGAFDALLFDLDGVVYVGPEAVPYAADVIADVRAQGVACMYVTNNAARTPQAVADHLSAIGVPAEPDQVITSPMAAVSVLARFVAEGSRVLVIGGEGIELALAERGYVTVRSLDDVPAAVIQGYSPDLTWRDLAEATFAVRSGLPWIATNRDLTFPTPRGVAPGNGSLVAVVARTVGREPDAVAGKPEPPLLLEAIDRAHAGRPLMIGDRLDTDIAAGRRIGIPSLLVFTGVTTFAELAGAIPQERPDYLGADLRVLVEPYPEVVTSDGHSSCGDAVARLAGAVIEVLGATDQPWDGLRAVAALAWRCADQGRPVDASTALVHLDSLRPPASSQAAGH
jgi:HAD superfamily hydrolase (TIGR01450 family)